MSALAVEKMMDLLAVAALGVAVLVLTGSKAHPALASAVLLVCTGTFGAAGFLLVAAKVRGFHHVLQRVAQITRVPSRWYRHWLRLRRAVAKACAHRPSLLFLQTILIWFVFYAMIYAVIGMLIGVELGASDIAVLMFAGAVGLALPGAPSGLGTYHAAVAAAFVLLGRPFNEGLALAVAAHAVFFVSLCSVGLVALIARQTRRQQPFAV